MAFMGLLAVVISTVVSVLRWDYLMDSITPLVDPLIGFDAATQCHRSLMFSFDPYSQCGHYVIEEDISMMMPGQDTCYAFGVWVRGAMIGAFWLLLLHCWLCNHLKMERESMRKDERSHWQNFITGSNVWFYFLSLADASITKGQVDDAFRKGSIIERKKREFVQDVSSLNHEREKDISVRGKSPPALDISPAFQDFEPQNNLLISKDSLSVSPAIESAVAVATDDCEFKKEEIAISLLWTDQEIPVPSAGLEDFTNAVVNVSIIQAFFRETLQRAAFEKSRQAALALQASLFSVKESTQVKKNTPSQPANLEECNNVSDSAEQFATEVKGSDRDASTASLSASDSDSEFKENASGSDGNYSTSLRRASAVFRGLQPSHNVPICGNSQSCSPEIESSHIGSESDDELPFIPHDKNFMLPEGASIDDIDDIIRQQAPVTSPYEGDEYEARMERMEAEYAALRKKLAEDKKTDDEYVFVAAPPRTAHVPRVPLPKRKRSVKPNYNEFEFVHRRELWNCGWIKDS
jgi:hypothetical protein